MYVFSIVAYVWLNEAYPEGFCDSTWICFLTAFDMSFKVDGGIGGFTDPASEVWEGNSGMLLFKFAFDNIYFIVLMIIMINILSGIIIDTFGTLRSELEAYEDDLNNICYICGFSCEYIEKNSLN